MQRYQSPEHLLRDASPSVIRTVVEQLLPEPNIRVCCLDALANAIQAAHRTQPTCWSTTLTPTTLMLHAGLHEVYQITTTTIELAVDRRNMDAYLLTLEDVQFMTMVYDRPTKSEMAEVRYELCVIPQRWFPVYYSLLRTAHEHAIAEAALEQLWRNARTNHAAGVLEYLRVALKREVPHPAYLR